MSGRGKDLKNSGLESFAWAEGLGRQERSRRKRERGACREYIRAHRGGIRFSEIDCSLVGKNREGTARSTQKCGTLGGVRARIQFRTRRKKKRNWGSRTGHQEGRRKRILEQSRLLGWHPESRPELGRKKGVDGYGSRRKSVVGTSHSIILRAQEEKFSTYQRGVHGGESKERAEKKNTSFLKAK